MPDETGKPELDHEYTLTPETIKAGLSKLHEAAMNKTFPAASWHYANIVTENYDASTADVVLQLGMFGDVIFGY